MHRYLIVKDMGKKRKYIPGGRVQANSFLVPKGFKEISDLDSSLA